MEIRETLVDNVDDYINAKLDRVDQGYTVVRNPDPPYYLGWLCKETGERYIISVSDFIATGNLERVKKIEKERKAAKKAAAKAKKAAEAAAASQEA